jgi:5-methylcytosine-specific restriction endonuclease McrA
MTVAPTADEIMRSMTTRPRLRQSAWRRLRLVILARDQYRCQIEGCRWPDRRADSVDHVVPVSMGGTDHPGNLRAAHISCNSRRNRWANVRPRVDVVAPRPSRFDTDDYPERARD